MNIWLSSLRLRAHLSWRTGKTSPCSPRAPNLLHVLPSRMVGWHNLCSPEFDFIFLCFFLPLLTWCIYQWNWERGFQLAPKFDQFLLSPNCSWSFTKEIKLLLLSLKTGQLQYYPWHREAKITTSGAPKIYRTKLYCLCPHLYSGTPKIYHPKYIVNVPVNFSHSRSLSWYQSKIYWSKSQKCITQNILANVPVILCLRWQLLRYVNNYTTSVSPPFPEMSTSAAQDIRMLPQIELNTTSQRCHRSPPSFIVSDVNTLVKMEDDLPNFWNVNNTKGQYPQRNCNIKLSKRTQCHGSYWSQVKLRF